MSPQLSKERLHRLEDFHRFILGGQKTPVTLELIKEKVVKLFKKTAKRVPEFEYLGTDTKVAYGGLVHKYKDNETGKIMAIRERPCNPRDPPTEEMNILESLPDHPSVVGFMGVTPSWSYVAMEHVETDLQTYMKKKEVSFTVDGVKKLMKKLLEGVNVLHEHGVVHMDLRPPNILIGRGGRDLKICNFAKAALRWGWFRSPEMQRHGCEDEVDMWNVGCIMAMFVLAGVGEDEQGGVMSWLYEFLGTPTRSGIGHKRVNFELGEDGHDLLKGLLSIDPNQRITAEAALNHVWFRDAA